MARIMIVEDEAIIALDLQAQLECLGHTITDTVISGEEAIAKADTDRPDLVLMDISLKGEMDGIEAAEIMRSASSTPIVFVSAHADRERLKRAMPTLPFGYLIKPFQYRDLVLTIEMALYASEIDRQRRQAEEERLQLMHELQIHQEELTCQNEELRDAQEELAASRDRYLDLFDLAPVGYATTDNRGRIIEVNRTLAMMLDVERPSLIGQPLSTFVLEQDQDACYLHLRRARAAVPSGQPASCELRMQQPSGEALWVRLVTMAAQERAEGTALRTAISDVSARRQAEAALAEEHRLATLSLESLPHPAMIIRKDRTVVMANRAATAIGAVPGEHCWNAFGLSEFIPHGGGDQASEHGKSPPGGTRCSFCRADSAMAARSPRENPEVCAHGRTWDLFWVPLDESTYLHWAVDISDRKRAEEDRRAFEAQVQQAQRMESLGVLAGGVAHDFNNMLGAITGYADLALDATEPGSEIHGYLEQLTVAATRATEMVKQILAFSRHAEGERQVVCLDAIVEEAEQLLRSTLPSSIHIRHEIAPHVPPVLADAAQLQQVIMNLGANAHHAMWSAGGVLTLRLTAERIDADTTARNPQAVAGEYVHLAVCDTGTGIPPQALDRIFEPFFTTKEIGKGTGMGLAISHGIVASHGGFITVESEAGTGSAFHVYFPAAAGVPEWQPPRKREDAIRGTERILIIDDESVMLEMVSSMLRKIGYAVTPYLKGRDALASLEQTPAAWDLLITDQTMPEIDGIAVLEACRGIRSDLPVVIMTGHSDKLTLDADGGIGADAVLRKPFRRPELAATLRRLLDSRSLVG